MKILIVTAAYNPTVNGVVTHVQSLKENLEKYGHEVWVLAPKRKGFLDQEKNIVRLESFRNPLNSDYPLAFGFFYPRSLKKIKFDIIHLHHPFGLTQVALRAKNKSGAKLIFTNHTQYEAYAEYYAKLISVPLRPLIRHLLKALYKKCDRVICSTTDIENYVKKINPKTKTEVIPVGFNDRALVAIFDKDKTRKMHHIKKSDFYLLYAGRIAAEKNIDYLIKSVKEIHSKNKNIKLVIVGGGDYLKKLAAEGNEYIIFTGTMKPDKLASHYQDCDLFASASTSETLGLVFAEAAFLGAPLLGIDSDGVRDVIKNNMNGILAKDEQEFKEILSDFAEGKIKIDDFKYNAKKTSLPFSATENSKKVEALYKDLIKK